MNRGNLLTACHSFIKTTSSYENTIFTWNCPHYFSIGNSLITSKYNQYKTLKTTILVSDADWENLNLMIERSPIDKVKENFELFVKKNVLQTTAINCKNGKYFGITPANDYGYFHVVFLEIHQGKIINIHYDELKSNGKNKRTDIDYNKEMLKSGTSPSIACPIFERNSL